MAIQIGGTTVINNSRGLQNITSGAILGIQSGGVSLGAGATSLNFIGSGNTFFYNSGTNSIDVSISGGAGYFDTLPAVSPPTATVVTQNTLFTSQNGRLQFSQDSGVTNSGILTATAGKVVTISFTDAVLQTVPSGITTSDTAYLQVVGSATSLTQLYVSPAADKTPDAFSLGFTTDTQQLAQTTSISTSITGINMPARIWGNIVNGTSPSISVNGGAYVALANTATSSTTYVSLAQTVSVRHTTASTSLGITTTTVFIGWNDSNKTTGIFTSRNLERGVAQPVILSPTNGQTGVARSTSFTGTAYTAIGGAGIHTSSDWQLATDSGFTAITTSVTQSSTFKTTWSIPAIGNTTTYFVRTRYWSDNTGNGPYVSAYSDTVQFTTIQSAVQQPGITSVRNGDFNILLSPTFTGSAYTAIGGAGIHTSSDWQLSTSPSFTSYASSVTQSSSNLTTWSVADLSPDTVYYVRVRYNSNNDIGGPYVSPFSGINTFRTVNAGVLTPLVTSPTSGSTGIANTTSYVGTAFTGVGIVNTFGSADFEVYSDTNLSTLVASEYRVQSTNWTPVGGVNANQLQYVRVRYRGTAGGTGTVYTSGWSTTTSFTTRSQAVSRPVISSPSNGATGVGFNNPTITSSSFSSTAGTHANTDWELLTSLKIQSVNAVTGVSSSYMPLGTYSLNGGGFYGGLISYTANAGVATYALFICPKRHELSSVQFKTANTTTAGTLDDVDGSANTTSMISDGNHPLTTLGISSLRAYSNNSGVFGKTDWYVPSRYELEVLYRNLKPSVTSNNTSSGANTYSVPVTSNYTTGSPGLTTARRFTTGGNQIFQAATYWSSTQANSTDAYYQSFDTGLQGQTTKTTNYAMRAIRRQLVQTDDRSAKLLYLDITNAAADGFYVGDVITQTEGNSASGTIATITSSQVGLFYDTVSGTFVSGQGIRRSSDTTVVTSYTNSTNKTSIGIGTITGASAQRYFVRTRYRDDGSSAAGTVTSGWSTATTFVVDTPIQARGGSESISGGYKYHHYTSGGAQGFVIDEVGTDGFVQVAMVNTGPGNFAAYNDVGLSAKGNHAINVGNSPTPVSSFNNAASTPQFLYGTSASNTWTPVTTTETASASGTNAGHNPISPSVWYKPFLGPGAGGFTNPCFGGGNSPRSGNPGSCYGGGGGPGGQCNGPDPGEAGPPGPPGGSCGGSVVIRYPYTTSESINLPG